MPRKITRSSPPSTSTKPSTRRLFGRAVVLGLLLGGLELGIECAVLGQQAAAFERGDMAEAARWARRVLVLRKPMATRVRTQVATLQAAADPLRELPLLEALVALTDEPALVTRLAGLRVEAAEPEALVVVSVDVQQGEAMRVPAAAPTPGNDMIIARPDGAREGEWGRTYTLTRRGKGGAMVPLGQAFAGSLGRSYDLLPNGRTLWVAREQERVIEHWDLQTGQVSAVPTGEEPEFVAGNPVRADDQMAYTTGGDGGDVLWLWENGHTRRIFPPVAAPPTSWLGFEWAPDGQSLLLRWQVDDPAGKTLTELVWLRPTGEVGLDVSLAAPIREVVPEWVPAAGGQGMGLAMPAGCWAWSAKDAAAVALEDVGGFWGFGPAGRLIAGIDHGQVFVLDPRHPKRRVNQVVSGLPEVIEGESSGFSWQRDRLVFSGQCARRTGEPSRLTRIEVVLATKRI